MLLTGVMLSVAHCIVIPTVIMSVLMPSVGKVSLYPMSWRPQNAMPNAFLQQPHLTLETNYKYLDVSEFFKLGDQNHLLNIEIILIILFIAVFQGTKVSPAVATYRDCIYEKSFCPE